MYIATICDDMWWYVMICDDMWWYVMICDDMWWYVMICDDMWWYVMICDDMWWYETLRFTTVSGNKNSTWTWVVAFHSWIFGGCLMKIQKKVWGMPRIECIGSQKASYRRKKYQSNFGNVPFNILQPIHQDLVPRLQWPSRSFRPRFRGNRGVHRGVHRVHGVRWRRSRSLERGKMVDDGLKPGRKWGNAGNN